MTIPKYWAECRLKDPVVGSKIKVKRFGWSDLSQSDAELKAASRAREALQRVIRGEKLPLFEPKRSYNGAAGVPIREEIISYYGDAVVTRNSYGSRCLNVPNVLFADLDFDSGLGAVHTSSTVIAGVIAAFIGITTHSAGKTIAGGFVAYVFFLWGMMTLKRLQMRIKGGPAGIARIRIDKFLESHPDWHLRVYRTPAGIRVLVMHRTFKPGEPATESFFEALGTDPLYVQMCQAQDCFRARVSGKPWRMGLDSSKRLSSAVWPVSAARMPERVRWVESYEAVAKGYAACKFLFEQGSDTIDPAAERIRQIHDQLSQTLSNLPIA